MYMLLQNVVVGNARNLGGIRNNFIFLIALMMLGKVQDNWESTYLDTPQQPSEKAK